MKTSGQAENKKNAPDIRLTDEQRADFIKSMKIGYYRIFYKQGLITAEQLAELIEMQTNPALKLFRTRHFAGKDQAIYTGFINDGQSTRSFKTAVLTVLLIFRIYVLFKRAEMIGISENRCDIFSDKPRFTLNNNGTNLTEFVIMKQLNLMIHDSPPFQRRHTIYR